MSTIDISERYQRCVLASRRVRWDIDADVIRGRRFDMRHKFLPDGLVLPGELKTLSIDEKRFASQIQGRTYANVFGLFERFINAKILELGKDHWFGDQVALEALVRFSEEEIKHQALFRRIEALIGEAMPPGYAFATDPNVFAGEVLGRSTWAVLALTLDIELFTQLHYRESIEADASLSELFKDVFLFHWKEESQHALLDELEWARHDATIDIGARDLAIDDFIALVGTVDGMLQVQARADAAYFAARCGRTVEAGEALKLEAAFLKAYRWQYIHSGAAHPHFGKVLAGMTNEAQRKRIGDALASLR